jgi:RHS repeat-associated protein
MNPEFDADGNQTLLKTTTGIWHVTYNAENRPILFSNETTVVEMTYDYLGRRFDWKETVSGVLIRHERYIYRGYLQIAALDILSSASVKHIIAWDPTEQRTTRPLALQVATAAYYYSIDQVKNVTELFDSTGALVATYDYAPFGAVTTLQISQSGNNAITQFSNPLTFSSEIHDSILGLQYYNYRHLNLLDGKWVNRDPIGEEGGDNIYAAMGNQPITRIDRLGLATLNIVYNSVYHKTNIRGYDWESIKKDLAFIPDTSINLGEFRAYNYKILRNWLGRICSVNVYLEIHINNTNMREYIKGEDIYACPHMLSGVYNKAILSPGILLGAVYAHELGHAEGWWLHSKSNLEAKLKLINGWGGDEEVRKAVVAAHNDAMVPSGDDADKFTMAWFKDNGFKVEEFKPLKMIFDPIEKEQNLIKYRFFK